MPEPYAFEPGVQYKLGGIGYHILKKLSNGQILVKNLMKKDEVTAQQIEYLKDEWHHDRLEFGLQGRNLLEEEGHTVKTSYVFTDLSFIKNTLIEQETWDRFELVLSLIDLAPNERTDERIKKTIETYVAQQVALIISGKRTSPVFPQRSGKGNKKASSNQDNAEYSSSLLEKAPEGVEGNRRRVFADVPLQRVGTRAVRRWMKDFENSRRDIRSLVPEYYKRGRREVKMVPEVKELLEIAVSEVYETEQRAQVTKVIDKLEFLILEANKKRPDDQPRLVMLNKRKVYRYVEQLDPMEVDTARMGRRYAERKHKQHQRGPRPVRPNERWEEDDTLGDLFVVDENDGLPIGRPLFTAIRDKCSAVVPGFTIGFEPSSARTVMECLYYAIPEKKHVKQLFNLRNDYVGYGVPEVLAVDRGKGYIGNDLKLACAQLGIELDPMPGRSPWLKGSIENYIKETGTDIFHATPGTSFSNFLVRGDYDPTKHACVTLDGLWYLLHKWVVDVYTRKSHRGVGGVPAKLWERALERDFFPRLPPSRKQLAILLSRVEDRVVQSTGIEFENLQYQDSRFSDLRGRLLTLSRKKKSLRTEEEKNAQSPYFVQFKYNPADLSRIWVLDPDQMRYIEVLACDQGYTQGLSIWKHLIIKRYAREQLQRDIDQETLILAKEELRQAMSDEFRLGKKLGSRKNAARFLDMQVSEALRRAQPAYSSTLAMNDVLSLNYLNMNDAGFELSDLEVLSPPSEQVQETRSSTIAEDVAQLNVPLPLMIEGVTLPINDEILIVGDRLPESEKGVGIQKRSSKSKKNEQLVEVPKESTDPDESTSFGITIIQSRRGPT